ncbi:MAG: hypothetical protein ACOY0R_17750 [Chloroflexota bacterium]
MARAGRRYPLLMYARMTDRWWPAAFALGLALFALAWAVWSYYPIPAYDWQWMTLAAVGGFAWLISLFLWTLKKVAYVQPHSDHLRLVTPFLRLNISYKRLRRSTSSTLESLFPPGNLSSWRREIVEPLAHKTAVVVELTSYPISQQVLKFFLSPFFFKDKTPHFVLLVEDWMHFSAELETMRAGGPVDVPRRRVDKSILSRLPHNK